MDDDKFADTPSLQGHWIVGLYHNSCQTEFVSFSDEKEAREVYDTSSSSKVLWQLEGANPPERKLQACYTAHWDMGGIGVATLLQGPGTRKGEEIIRKELHEGLVPFIPPGRTQTVQFSIKLSMKLAFHRNTIELFAAAPLRYRSIAYFEHLPAGRTHVALTFDDGPCRFKDRECSELPRVLKMLREYNMKATFMIVGSWCEPHREDLILLLKDGHELGNHCMMDRSYEFDSPEDFAKSVDECSRIILDLQQAAGVEQKVRWFRAPHGRFTQEMADVLKSRNLVNVMCDTYASCPIVEDADFIATHLTKTCRDGSIILLHMPEKLVRQWCFGALEGLLEGLKDRNIHVGTIGDMARLSDMDIIILIFFH